MASERVLTRRELNRALLERQLLLDRKTLSPVKAVERLGGLQAQSTTSPYLSLWTRLEGFQRDQLVRALKGRRLVKAIIQRGTLHIVTPSDYWAFATARRELGGILWPPSYAARLPTAPAGRARGVGRSRARGRRADLQGGPRAARALREAGALADVHLAPHPGTGVRRARPAVGDLGLRRPRRVHGRRGNARGGPPPPEEAFDQLVRSYLAAYGPATKQDIGAVGRHPAARADHSLARAAGPADVPRRARMQALRPSAGAATGGPTRRLRCG